MLYEEKIINGVLFCRSNPSRGWRQVSIEELSRRVVGLEKISELNQIQSEAKAIEDLISGVSKLDLRDK